MSSKFILFIFVLTTNLIDLCRSADSDKEVKEKFSMDIEQNDDKGTPIVRAFKAGFFGGKTAKNKRAYVAGATRAASESSSKKNIKKIKEEEIKDEEYRDAALAGHEAGRKWGLEAKQAFSAGATVGATNALGSGLNKIKLKQAPAEQK